MTESIAVESRRAATERLAVLRERFGAFPARTRTFVDDPARFRRGVEQFREGFRGSARARITDDDGRVLLVCEPERAGWGLPGGGNEPDESLVDTARREAFEETGVEISITGVWAATLRRYVDRETPARRGYLLSVAFEARQTGGTAGLYPERWDEGDETVTAVEWFETPPADARGVVTDPTAWEPVS